jgi:LPPG:FO 2-phospho-L-lactate transferase
MIVALAGGVGGAKLAHGLYATLDAGALTVVLNTGDDFDLYGLRIMPDADTVLYTLAGLANPATGWGIAGDTAEMLGMLQRYGEDTWFWLGDRDLATHILRTVRLHAGWSPTRAIAACAEALGVRAALLPMCDEQVATMVQTPAGELPFQDYFVRRRQRDEVIAVRFDGIERAAVPAGVSVTLDEAETIVLCPSNPLVSIGPILAVPGMRERIQRSSATKVAVSPIVGGKALKGPADRMLAGLGVEVSPYGVASLYRDVVEGMVIDRMDAVHGKRIEALGVRVLVTDTVMRVETDRARLAREVLAFAAHLRADRADHAGGLRS